MLSKLHCHIANSRLRVRWMYECFRLMCNDTCSPLFHEAREVLRLVFRVCKIFVLLKHVRWIRILGFTFLELQMQIWVRRIKSRSSLKKNKSMRSFLFLQHHQCTIRSYHMDRIPSVAMERTLITEIAQSALFFARLVMIRAGVTVRVVWIGCIWLLEENVWWILLNLYCRIKFGLRLYLGCSFAAVCARLVCAVGSGAEDGLCSI